jgi:hypothetical protein
MIRNPGSLCLLLFNSGRLPSAAHQNLECLPADRQAGVLLAGPLGLGENDEILVETAVHGKSTCSLGMHSAHEPRQTDCDWLLPRRCGSGRASVGY